MSNKTKPSTKAKSVPNLPLPLWESLDSAAERSEAMVRQFKCCDSDESDMRPTSRQVKEVRQRRRNSSRRCDSDARVGKIKCGGCAAACPGRKPTSTTTAFSGASMTSLPFDCGFGRKLT